MIGDSIREHQSECQVPESAAHLEMHPTWQSTMDRVNPILVECWRGETIESFHRGAVTIADAHGRIVASCGDTSRPVFRAQLLSSYTRSP